MSKARELAELGAAYDSGALSNRNMIINGAMQCWQRGTSASGGSISSFVFIADRFWMYAPSSSSGTISQSTDVPSGEGFVYSLYNNLNASCSVGTNVELEKQGADAPFVNGEQYTLSFYVKAGSASSGVAISVSTRDNSGGTGSVVRASLTFDISTSWVRVEKTFTLSATVGGSNRCLQFEFSLPVGGYVTGFQLERGTEATPFEHRTFGDELARCQRYFHKHNVDYFLNTIRSGDDARKVTCVYPTTMRTTPSIVLTSSNLDGASSITTQGITTGGVRWKCAGQANSDAPSISEFTADAEL